MKQQHLHSEYKTLSSGYADVGIEKNVTSDSLMMLSKHFYLAKNPNSSNKKKIITQHKCGPDHRITEC